MSPFKIILKMSKQTKVEAKKFLLISLQTYNELLNGNKTVQDSQTSTSTTKEYLLSHSNKNNETDVAAQLSVAATLNQVPKPGGSNQETDEMIPREHQQNNLISDEANEIVEQLLSTGLSSGKIEKSKAIIKLLQKSETIAIDKQTGKLQNKSGGPPSESNLFQLLMNIQHPTKKFSPADLELIRALKIAQHLVANTNAKAVSLKLTRDSNNTWLSMFSPRY